MDAIIFEELDEFGHYSVRFSEPILKELLVLGATKEQIKAYLEDLMKIVSDGLLEQMKKSRCSTSMEMKFDGKK